MSNKRRGQEDQRQVRGGDYSGNKRSRCQRKHLYLVLDDLKNGFSIHKIDPDTLDSDAGHLPEPALLRLESPVGCVAPHGHHGHMSFSALGTKIFVFMNQRCALVYDTDTAVLTAGPHAPDTMVCGFGITVPAGGVMYHLSHRFFDKQHSFQAMSEGWSWKTLPPPPPTFTSRQRVISYALHPDGCTIFMTTANRDTPGAPLSTYSFNTNQSEWRCHGDWALPFRGQGYFDSELDAWIGLCGDGYICSCQVASRSRTGATKLDWHKNKTKLFCKDWDTHLASSLTHMGSSKFCLVETVAVEQGHALHRGCVLNLTVFGLKFNHKGELQATSHRSTRSYLVSRHKSFFVPFAFWM